VPLLTVKLVNSCPINPVNNPVPNGPLTENVPSGMDPSKGVKKNVVFPGELLSRVRPNSSTGALKAIEMGLNIQ